MESSSAKNNNKINKDNDKRWVTTAIAVSDSWRGDEEVLGRVGGRQAWGKDRLGGGGATPFSFSVLDMKQPLLERRAQGLFDVEIGQFESVSFNFSQLTRPPWVPHVPLIGYKLVFFFVLSLPWI